MEVETQVTANVVDPVPAQTRGQAPVTLTWMPGLQAEAAERKLSFPAGMLNFRSTCGVCDSWGLVRDGIRHCEWSGSDGCLLGEVGDRGFVGAVCLAQR